MRTPLLLAIAFSAFTGTAFAVDVTECGQVVPDKETGVLTTDLSCPPTTVGVTLGRFTTLDLNGHTITAPDGWGVWCLPRTRCTVTGGEIHDGRTGVYVQTKGRLTMTDVTIRNASIGVEAEDWNNGRSGGSVTLTNVHVTGCTGAALLVGKLNAEDVVLDANPGSGIGGVASTTVKADGLAVTGNAFSDGCDVYGCSGIEARVLRGSNVVVTGNAGIGIKGKSVNLRDSTVSDNVRAGVLKDLVTSVAPRLRNVDCGVSLGWGSAGTTNWGVCAFDAVP